MKSLLLKSVLLIIAYFLIASAAILNSSDSITASESQQNLNLPLSCIYNSSYNNSSINFVSQSNIAQAPTSMSVGNGYYSAHPISYGGAIGSQTWIKNQRSSTLVQQDISYAHGVDSQINVMATDNSHSLEGPRGSKSSSSSTTHMKIDEDVTNGSVHIGVLQGSYNSGLRNDAVDKTNSGKDSSLEAWKNPALEIDEDYIGTYHIHKNMTISTSHIQNQRNDSWLDILSGGYLNIILPGLISNDPDRVFNCKVADPSKVLETGLK